MKNKFSILFLFIVPIITFAQVKLIEGRVLDYENIPVPYSYIVIKGSSVGTIADETGYFSLSFPEKFINDSLFVSSVGFESKSLKILEIKNYTILLKNATYTLPQVTVYPEKGKIMNIGSVQKEYNKVLPLWCYWSFPFSISAKYIENPSERACKLISVSYYIPKEGIYNTPFRVRVYAKDSTIFIPSTDILPKSVVVQSNIEGDWFEVDLSSFNIICPPDGFFVGMEWLNLKNKKFRYKSKWKAPVRNKDGGWTKSEKKYF